MRETADLIRAWRGLPAGTPAILATVIGTSGSTYRRPGARMLLTRDGWLAGSISGGCLESDVVKTAWQRTESGPALVTYDATSDEDIVWGFGLGCNGVVQVLMERLPLDGGVLSVLDMVVKERRRAVIGTVVSEGLRLGKRFTTDDHPSDSFAEAVLALMAKAKEGGLVSVGGEVVLIEPLSPPQSLIIFGAGHDAIPLAQMAKLVGWHVTVVDGRSAYAVAGRFPEVDHVVQAFAHDIPAKLPIPAGAAAVVMTHNYLHDLQLLKTLLPSPATYVGLLGPRRRADKLLSELGCSPVASQLAKLHAPIGLDLAAEGPDEIALAIVAEIQAFLKRRDPGFLRDSAKPLHDGENAVVLDSSAEVPICRFLA